MLNEEIPKDLSAKPSPRTENEDNNRPEETDGLNNANNDNKSNEADVEMMDTDQTKNETNGDSIDLSVRKKDTEEEPVAETLDLSVTNSKSKPEPTDTKKTEDVEMVDADAEETEEPVIQVNDKHINGFVSSNDMNGKEEADDDIIPLSPPTIAISDEELRSKLKKMRRLKQELRNEEMKLVLLKKLRQSQLMKENIVTPTVNQPNSHSSAPVNHSAAKLLNNMSSRNGSMAPSSMPTQNMSSGHSRTTNHGIKSHSVLNPPIGRNHNQSHGPICPPPLGMTQRSNSNHMPTAAHSSSLRPGPLSSMNRTPVTTPPNVVLGYPIQDIRNQTNSSNSLLSAHQSLGLANTGSPGPNSAEATQTPAQRQAAAKLALRKQLEKTLLQIPPPKPPPPEMHFIPNANNQEFVYYIGLETVVDFLTDSPNQNRPPPDPFECVQCGTDFTPVWKWQDRIDPNRDRPAVICENCVTSNIKKALKAEHTNRLKTAFVKALQQEQEIEQRIASGATSPPLPSISPPQQQQTNYNGAHQNLTRDTSRDLVNQPSNQSRFDQPQAPPAHSSMSRGLGGHGGSAANAAAAAAAVASSALLQQLPKLSAAHQQSLFAAQAQQLHQLAQSLPQPQPAHMLPFAPLLAAQAYSYSMLGKSGMPSTDLHRQYLLDMIPPRSLPQSGSMNWKT